MQIEDNRKSVLRCVNAGEVFEYLGTQCIRTDSNEYTAVNLEGGVLERFDLDTSVVVIDSALLVLE